MHYSTFVLIVYRQILPCSIGVVSINGGFWTVQIVVVQWIYEQVQVRLQKCFWRVHSCQSLVIHCSCVAVPFVYCKEKGPRSVAHWLDFLHVPLLTTCTFVTIWLLALTLVVCVLHMFVLVFVLLMLRMCHCLTCSFHLTTDHALLTMLQQANLITREEREGLTDPNDVAKIQSSKSSKVMDDTACIMRKFKHQRFQKASSFLSGMQTTSSTHLYYAMLCYAIRWSISM